MTSVRRLSAVTAITTLVLVAAGGLVRATGSGLGCLDEWPRCHGSWVAPLEYHALIEYAHRLLAAVVGVLVLALAVVAWRKLRDSRPMRIWAAAAVPVVVAQGLLGRVVVTSELHAAYVTAHLVLAMLLVAITTGLAVRSAAGPRTGPRDPRLAGMTAGLVVATFFLLIAGALVREKGAGLAFGDWPLFDGALIPSLEGQARQLNTIHRLFAAAVFGHMIATYMSVRRDPRGPVRVLSALALGLFTIQVAVGGLNVLTDLAPMAVLAHVAFGGLSWAAVVGLAVAARSGAGRAPAETAAPSRSGPRRGVTGTLSAFLALTKPRIIVLLLVTTIPAMVLAAREMPPAWLVFATLLGGTMTAGSANAINQFLERDIDVRMNRTRGRPLPTDRVGPHAALVFGVLLGVAGTAWLVLTVNAVAAALAAAAIVFYVGVYTALLKRNTPQNIVIGGAAGAAPALVGWAAVTGSLSGAAWVMFAIIFFWTPPHFWALAVKYRDDYAAAGVPMLPVVRGMTSTARQILAYTLVLAAVTALLVPVGGMGAVYVVAAALLGGAFIWLAWRLVAEPTTEAAMRLFRYSISYLALLFLAIAVDGILQA